MSVQNPTSCPTTGSLALSVLNPVANGSFSIHDQQFLDHISRGTNQLNSSSKCYPKAKIRKEFAANLREKEHPLLDNSRPGLKGFRKLESGRYCVWMNNADGTSQPLGDMTAPPPAPGLWSTGSMLLNKRDEVPVITAIAVYMLRLWGLKSMLFVPDVYDNPPPPREMLLKQLEQYEILSGHSIPDDMWEKYVKPILPLGPYYVKGMSDSPRARAKRQYEALSRVLLSETHASDSRLAADSKHIVLSLRQGFWNEGSQRLGIQYSIDIKPCMPIKYAQLFDLCRAVVGTNPTMRTATPGGGRREKWEIFGPSSVTADSLFPNRVKKSLSKSKKRQRKTASQDEVHFQSCAVRALDALGQCVGKLYKQSNLADSISLQDFTQRVLEECTAITSERYPYLSRSPFPSFTVIGEGAEAYIDFHSIKLPPRTIDKGEFIKVVGNVDENQHLMDEEKDEAAKLALSISDSSIFSV